MDYKQNEPNRNFARRNGANMTPDDFLKENSFDGNWIKNGADEVMVKFTEKAGKYMASTLSKSQIRNVFGELKRIQLKGIDTSEGYTSFMLLKPKVAYAEARNRNVGLTLFKKIFDKAWAEVEKDQKVYNNFCAFIEAVLAYHKAFGGKD